MANITKVYLLSVPLENDYKDTLYFANATAQHNYFAGQVVKSYTDFSYQRKDSVIRVPAIVDSIRNCNYVMYQNSAYSNKWFYAFINRMVYIDDGRTDIYISTDVLQTWMFEMNFKDSFIEREHVNDDTIGIHTMPEGLDTGEYVCNDTQDVYYAKKQYWDLNDTPFLGQTMICVQVSTLTLTKDKVTTEPTNIPAKSIVNGIPQASYIVALPYNEDAMAGIYALTGAYDGAGRGDAIISMFLCPMAVATTWTTYTGPGIWNSGYYMFPQQMDGAFYSTSITITSPTELDGYQPHNNKCYVGPYNYFHITNNCGSDIEFNYEDFIGAPYFGMSASFEQGASIILKPNNSKRSSHYTTYPAIAGNGYSEGVMGAKLPLLSWQNDYYLNWVAQNGKNIAIQTGLAAAGWATNALSGMIGGATGRFGAYDSALNTADTLANQYGYEDIRTINAYNNFDAMPSASAGGGFGLVGSTLNLASQVASASNAIRQAKMVPPQAKGNTSGGYLQFAMDNCKFTVYKMSCRAEYIRAIDSYFDMFGYKVNRLGKPLKNHRQNWWYTKTIGANIDGNIPNEDMEIIKAIYNNGVTYWKNPANIKNYSVSNNIVA